MLEPDHREGAFPRAKRAFWHYVETRRVRIALLIANGLVAGLAGLVTHAPAGVRFLVGIGTFLAVPAVGGALLFLVAWASAPTQQRNEARAALAPAARAMTDAELKELCARTSGDINEFLADREALEPAMNWSSWFNTARSERGAQEARWRDAAARYREETMKRFDSKFQAQLVRVFEGLVERGLVNPLDRHMYEYPTDLAQAQAIAEALGDTAVQMLESR